MTRLSWGGGVQQEPAAQANQDGATIGPKSSHIAIIRLSVTAPPCPPAAGPPRAAARQEGVEEPLDAAALAALDDHFTFLIASNPGRNGCYDQKPVAEMMGEVADIAGVEFVAAAGGVHHFPGVRSVNDPLCLTNSEWIYTCGIANRQLLSRLRTVDATTSSTCPFLTHRPVATASLW